MYIVKSDAGQPLRDELAKSPQKILASAFPEFVPKADVVMTPGSSTPPTGLLGDESLAAPQSDVCNPRSSTSAASPDSYFRGLVLVKTLVKLIPTWLQNNRVVFDTLLVIWKSPARISRLQSEQELDLVQVSYLRVQMLMSSVFVYHIMHWDKQYALIGTVIFYRIVESIC